jgi:hypothetical protein
MIIIQERYHDVIDEQEGVSWPFPHSPRLQSSSGEMLDIRGSILKIYELSSRLSLNERAAWFLHRSGEPIHEKPMTSVCEDHESTVKN